MSLLHNKIFKARSDKMAQYKQGFKRKNDNPKWVNFSIYGLVGAAVVAILVLVFNAILNPPLKYDDFLDVTIETMPEITQQEEESYLVYYYGEDCGWCKTIKDDVLSFANENNGGVKVYLIESAEDKDPTIIVDPTTNAPMTGTPTMVTVKNGVVVDLNIGPDLIIDLIKQVNEGTYGHLN